MEPEVAAFIYHPGADLHDEVHIVQLEHRVQAVMLKNTPTEVNAGLTEKWVLTACVMVNTSQPVEWTGMSREDSSFFPCVLFLLVWSS